MNYILLFLFLLLSILILEKFIIIKNDNNKIRKVKFADEFNKPLEIKIKIQ